MIEPLEHLGLSRQSLAGQEEHPRMLVEFLVSAGPFP